MDLTLWLAFAAASMAVLTIPGPTILLVMSYALSQGRRVALSSAAGVALGDAAAMTASLAGLGALVLASATLFTVLKWVGAVYLLWMGWRLWRAAGGLTLGDTPEGEIGGRAVFWHAAVVTALNPKSIVFFIAFVPQFVDPAAALVPQFAVLISTFVTLAVLNALIYALLAARLRDRLRRPPVLRALGRAGGAALMGMALLTALTRRAV
ncbi:LysE family translocator [Jannaschia seohaensis]|uniref:Threonine/homoserine/homoserine lactone efflux protein n=1 Tax=Jannaschia seohaensis TaxID=475081 RepID=A0A2Y9BW21_9RHOB|nr:LysE family transporter [Jannaschia seohaensis]PWJ22044.1 threonine/homoserine/homoserine lactone efflux protein [Jannaschia seohaensis]SSA38322.1 Threonine/homoserine/homoserine lactone efflux protein [Jannaschia seohaensis]